MRKFLTLNKLYSKINVDHISDKSAKVYKLDHSIYEICIYSVHCTTPFPKGLKRLSKIIYYINIIKDFAIILIQFKMQKIFNYKLIFHKNFKNIKRELCKYTKEFAIDKTLPFKQHRKNESEIQTVKKLLLYSKF